jgi:hypothetical protein
MPEASVSRDGYVVLLGTPEYGSWAWGLQALWNGTVTVEFASSAAEGAHRPSALDSLFAWAWEATAEPLAELTGIPDREHVATHLALHLTSGFHLHIQGISGFVRIPAASRPIQRWTTMAKPSEEELESITRELTRSAGIESFGSGGPDGEPNA